VFFVVDTPNSGQVVLDVVMTKVNRERQKLMREQNILKQVRRTILNKPSVMAPAETSDR
jgi:hypothetical protein